MHIFVVENKKEEITYYYGDITKIFKNMMGDFVKSAQILLFADYGCTDNPMEYARQRANKIQKDFNKNKSGIDCDATSVYITFENGKTVKFYNSEWGTISKSTEVIYIE